MKTLYKKYSIYNILLLPIVREIPFLCLYYILMSGLGLKLFKSVAKMELDSLSWYFPLSSTIVFLTAYLIALLMVVCNRKWVKIVVYSFFFSLFVVDFFLYYHFRMHISSTLFVLLAETNAQESSEFMSTFMGLRANAVVYTVTIAIILIAVYSEKYYQKRLLPKWEQFVTEKKWLSLGLSVLVAVILVAGCCSSRTYVRMFKCENTDDLSFWDLWDEANPKDPLTNTACAFYGIHLAKNESLQAIDVTKNIDKNLICHEDSVTLVFVIGESYSKYHAGIYGYELNTTPHQKEEQSQGNMFVLNDVCTPFNMTSYSMKNMLCCNSVSEGEAWYQSLYFPAIFKTAGYDVFFWDNQKDWDSGTSWAFALNSFLYNKHIMSFYTDTNKKGETYDGELIDSYVKNGKKTGNSRKLVMFHLRGQHIAAAERYPQVKEFMVFTPDSIHRTASFLNKEKKEKIAHYDNATYYNDYVIHKITEFLKKENAVMIYLSDHGEEMFDFRDHEGRNGNHSTDANILRYQYGIPFVIWCSPIYQDRHPEVIKAIREATNRPFMIDNICQVLFHLGGIESSYYKPERDPLTDQYRKPKRLVNRTIDYDAFVKQK